MFILYLFIILYLTYYIYISIYNNNMCPSEFKVFVTGSSSNHFHLLILMLYRIKMVEENICIIVGFRFVEE